MRKLLLLSLLLTSFFSIGQTGRIAGRVLDQEGLPLPGATISFGSIQPISTLTKSDGSFSMTGLPIGKGEIKVTYIGYQMKVVPVSIGSETLDLTVTLDDSFTLLEGIVVKGDGLKGQAKALNQQKGDIHVTNVVSADQIGRFPDSNIGDAIKRIPGITMQNDQGEARNIIVRGMASALNSVTLNGERVPSAEGDNRNIQMDLIPADMVQTIEVNKVVLPHMDADAIGGSVNLVTRAASNKLRVSTTVGSGINLLSQKPMSNFAMVIGNRSKNQKLGFVLSGSYFNHIFGSDNFEAEWAQSSNTQNPLVVEVFDIRKYDVQRTRRSGSLALDYRLKPGHTVYLNAMYNWRDDWENRYRFRVDRIARTFDANSARLNADGTYALTGRVAIQTKGGADTDRTKNARLEDQRVKNLTLGGEDLWGKLKMKWSYTLASASEDRPFERYITHRGNGAVVYNGLDPEKPLVTLANSTVTTNLALNQIYESNNFTQENDHNARVDFQLPVNRSHWKWGGRVRVKEKSRVNSYDIYAPIGNVGNGGNRFGQFTTETQNDRIFINGAQYIPGSFVPAATLGNLDLYNSSLFNKTDAIAEYITSNYQANERILAGYVMNEWKFDTHFQVIAGLRYEHTLIRYTGFALDEGEEVATPTPETRNNYGNLLPSVLGKYNFSDRSQLKFAWTNTLARPNYFDLVPFANYNPDDQVVVRGNPDLKATTSSNFDLMYENYLPGVGIVSAGVFAKDVRNFIYSQTSLNVQDPQFGLVTSRTRPENGGSAWVNGVEVAFQRQLDFLPGFLKNFGIYGNYTFTQSTTEGIEGREQDNLVLPGTAKHMVNASLSYQTEKFLARVSLNRTSGYLDAVGGADWNDIYYDKQLFLDVNASYAFTPKLRVYLEGNNLTNQPLRYYQGQPQYTLQEEFYNARFQMGVKFDVTGK